MKIPTITRPRAIVIALLSLLVIGTWLSPLDGPAERYVSAGFTRAALTFGSARALNSAISVVKGTEISAGVGLSATFSVGEILDPIDDLVEQFGDLMLLATVSFGIQGFLLAIGKSAVVKLGVTLILLSWGCLLAIDVRRPRWLLTLLLLGLMARFAIPVAAVSSNAIFHGYLEKDYQASELGIKTTREVFDKSADSVKEMQPQPEAPAAATQATKPTPANQGLWDSATSWLQDAATTIKEKTASLSASLDPRPTIERLKKFAEDGTRYIINLIVDFVLETLIVPLIVLFGLYAVARSLLRSLTAGLDSWRSVPQAPRESVQ